MFRILDNLTNRAGDALAGYYVKLKGESGYAALYSDASQTPIIAISGIADTARTNTLGEMDFWVANGTYDIEIYDKNDPALLFRSIIGVPMFASTPTPSAAVDDVTTATFSAPSGGSTQDAEARAALVQVAVDSADIRAQLNTLLLRLREQNLIAGGSEGVPAAPFLSVPVDIASGSVGANLLVTTSIAGGLLYAYISTSATPPVAADLLAGTGAVVQVSQAVTSAGVQTVPITTGLAASTQYFGHFMQRDGANQNSNIVSGDGFLTSETADTTAPTLTSPTDTQTGTTTATLTVSTNEANGTLYWFVSTSATPPTAANLKTGTGAAASGSQAVSGTGTQSRSVTGLTASTGYYGHFLHRDAAGNDSAIVTGDGFTTTAVADVTAPTLSSPNDAANGQTGANLSVSTNEANGTLYFYISTSATPPSAADLKTSTGDVVGGSQIVTATGVQTVTFPTGLTAGTDYFTHYLHRDAAGNDSAIVSADGFTTDAVPDTSPVSPSGSWTGTAGSGYTTTPTDPTRTTAKPVLRLMTPPNQYFTDELVIGVMAAANNAGTLATNLGLQKVTLYYEGTARDIYAPTVHTFNDANGVSRSYLGWWATIKKPTGTAGHANVYFEAVPADSTMQNRVIGPFQFSPQAALHDATLEVAATPAEEVGVRYKTIAAALAWCRTNTKHNPLITITETGNYDLLTIGGVAFNTEGYATISASVPVTITRPAAYSGGATVYFRTGFDGVRFRGSNITIDMLRMEYFYTENAANRRYWFDGCNITDSGGRYYLNRGVPHGFGGAFVRFGGIFTECAISNVCNVGNESLIVRGNAFSGTFNDVAVSSLYFAYNTVEDHSSEEYRTELPALTIDGPTGATIEYTGAAGANNRVFTAKVGATTAGTFTTLNTEAGWTANTNYTVQNVVDWVNSLGGGWTATLLDNTRAASCISTAGNSSVGAAFAATSCASPLTLITVFDQHADVWANSSSYLENLICYSNRCWDINSQGLYVNVTNSKDILIANNALHGVNPNYVMNMGGIHSHVVVAHNSIAGQVFSLRNDVSYNPDAYSAFLNNTVPELRYVTTGSPDANLIIRDNHLQTGAVAPTGAGASGTTIGGTGVTLFTDAANGNFNAIGALLTNLKTPSIAWDQVNAVRAVPSAVGSGGGSGAATAYHLTVSGQSNALGNGTGGQPVDADYVTDPYTLIWTGTALSPYQAGENSYGSSLPSDPVCWGPEAEYIRQWRAANGTTPLIVTMYGKGGSALYPSGASNWDPATGDLYDTLVADVNAAKAAAIAMGYASPIPLGMLWTQGESDCQGDASAAAYGTNLAGFIAACRTDFLGASAPFMYNRMRTGVDTYLPERIALVQDGQRAVAMADPTALCVFADDIPEAMQLHPGPAGIREIGNRYYKAFAGTLAPTILNAATASGAENAAITVPLKALSPVTWAISGGADQAKFTYSSGTLTLAAQDFETPTDAGANNIYDVQVTATQTNGLTATKAIAVTITNVTEGGTGYEAEADALISRLTGTYTTDEKAKINTFVKALKDGGIWSKLETLGMAHLMKNPADKLLDWVRSSVSYVNNGADLSGTTYASDGTGTKWIETGFDKFGATKAALKNEWYAAGVAAVTPGSTKYLVGAGTGSPSVAFQFTATTTQVARLGGGTEIFTIVDGNAVGRWTVARTVALPNSLGVARNGGTRVTAASSASTWPTSSATLVLFRTAGSNYGAGALDYFAYGASLTDAQDVVWDAAVAAFMAP